ncbi:hypothetical protein B0T26DRAFT_640833 [Lasiosphaeria miniovina]|uniref:Polyprenal reductase n=1 Tax=Lasiosphaeria miniovina TaxID=1954250 RepID=A0AA40AUW5_9PEZI|nr:uncharacterized protein B0T26DRAFT_640833 [Lasiosphaeria miniovina]KAK0722384.1 hypothetical protein B0T26DRAFT_640833 [Lasiosphaeria miniovina]
MAWPQFAHETVATLAAVQPSQWCQAFFLGAAGGVAVVVAAPVEARTLLMDYGARKAHNNKQQQQREGQHQQGQQQAGTPASQTSPSRDRLLSLVAAVSSWGQVPHSWFVAFYMASLGCSLFWLVQYLTQGRLLDHIAARQVAAESRPPAALGQVAVAWVIMFLQASRRVFEHATIIKPSKSTIWFVHWVLGLCFYLCISVSIWVDGSNNTATLFKILFATPIFLFAWVNQYRCHKYLAGLKKYSLPDEGLFRHLICPHYTCECLVYLSLAVVTAPPGQLCNKTLLCALLFVAINLGATASGTHKWYGEKFGAGAVAGKWNMIPFLF